MKRVLPARKCSAHGNRRTWLTSIRPTYRYWTSPQPSAWHADMSVNTYIMYGGERTGRHTQQAATQSQRPRRGPTMLNRGRAQRTCGQRTHTIPPPEGANHIHTPHTGIGLLRSPTSEEVHPASAGSLRSPAVKHRGAAPQPSAWHAGMAVNTYNEWRTEDGQTHPTSRHAEPTASKRPKPCLTAGERSEPADRGHTLSRPRRGRIPIHTHHIRILDFSEAPPQEECTPHPQARAARQRLSIVGQLRSPP